MQIFKKIFLWLFIILGLIFICLSVYLQLYGKNILEKKIKEKYGVNVSIGYLFYAFPSGLYAINVEGKDLFEAKDVIAQFDIKSFIDRKIKINNIEARGGSADISDKYLPKGISLNVRDIDIKVYNFIYPMHKQKTEFVVTGMVKDKKGVIDDKLSADGWIDIFSKDMDAKVKIIDKSGKINLSAKLISKNDDLKVNGSIDLSVINKNSVGQNGQLNNNNIILSLMSKLGIGINARFSFHTKMSAPGIMANEVFFSGDIIKKDNNVIVAPKK